MSKFSPGPAVKSRTLTWEAAPGGLKFMVETVNSQGQTAKTENLERTDGTESPITGANGPTGATRALKRIDAHTYEDMDRRGGKVTFTRRIVISPDGKTVTVTSKGTTPDGQAVNNVEVFEKQ